MGQQSMTEYHAFIFLLLPIPRGNLEFEINLMTFTGRQEKSENLRETQGLGEYRDTLHRQ